MTWKIRISNKFIFGAAIVVSMGNSVEILISDFFKFILKILFIDEKICQPPKNKT
jgi:hypothetical protein